MSLLYHQLHLDSNERLQKLVTLVAESVNLGELVQRDNKSPESVWYVDEFEEGLEFLQRNKILLYSKSIILGKHPSFSVTITNRYVLSKLNVELVWLAHHTGEYRKYEEMPVIDGSVYYESKTGNILINGTRKTLKNTNKKLFDALFSASPDSASRDKLLKIIGKKRNEKSSKIALNEAFSNLRKACKVTSKTIGLSNEGGTLNAHTFLLSAAQESPIIFARF